MALYVIPQFACCTDIEGLMLAFGIRAGENVYSTDIREIGV